MLAPMPWLPLLISTTSNSFPPTERVIEARETVGGGVQKIFLGQGNAKDVMCQVDADLAKLQ